MAPKSTDPAERPPAESITYAAAANVVSVRGFRLLTFLTLVNTVLLAGYVLGPQFFGFAKAEWAAYQQRKADRVTLAAKRVADRAEAAARAVEREAAVAAEVAAMTYADAPGTLVYDDDPALRDAPPPTTDPAAAAWPAVVPQPQAYRDLPRVASNTSRAIRDPASTCLYLHARQASAESPRRIVLVTCDAEVVLRTRAERSALAGRGFETSVLSPTSADADLKLVSWANRAWQPTPLGGPLRLFAGQSDPADPSRFTIAYEANGFEGVIRGQLLVNDSVRLEPEGPLADGWRAGPAR